MNISTLIDLLGHKPDSVEARLIRHYFAQSREEPVRPRWQELIDNGQWITGIKEYRAEFGVTLAQARVAIDAYRDTLEARFAS